MASPLTPSRLEAFTVTAPAFTPILAPLEIPTAFAPGELVGYEVVIPEGHANLTGLRLLMAHAQAIPATQGGWIIGDGENVSDDIVGQLNTGAWSAQVYNLDRYDHSWQVRFRVADFPYVTNPVEVTHPVTPLRS